MEDEDYKVRGMKEMVEKKEYPVKDLIASPIELLLTNEAAEPMANVECKIVLKDNKEIVKKTDDDGILKFIKTADGEFKVILQEEE